MNNTEIYQSINKIKKIISVNLTSNKNWLYFDKKNNKFNSISDIKYLNSISKWYYNYNINDINEIFKKIQYDHIHELNSIIDKFYNIYDFTNNDIYQFRKEMILCKDLLETFKNKIKYVNDYNFIKENCENYITKMNDKIENIIKRIDDLLLISYENIKMYDKYLVDNISFNKLNNDGKYYILENIENIYGLLFCRINYHKTKNNLESFIIIYLENSIRNMFNDVKKSKDNSQLEKFSKMLTKLNDMLQNLSNKYNIHKINLNNKFVINIQKQLYYLKMIFSEEEKQKLINSLESNISNFSLDELQIIYKLGKQLNDNELLAAIFKKN